MEEAQREELKIDLAKMIPGIAADIAERIKLKTEETFHYEAQQILRAQIQEYVRKEIVPSIQEELKTKHEEIRAAFVACVGAGCKAISDKMVDVTTKRLTSYEGDSLVRTFFDTIWGNSSKGSDVAF